MSTIDHMRMTERPLSTGATAIYPFPHSHDLKERFTFTSRFGDEVELFRVDGDLIHLPRAICPVGFDDLRGEGEPITFPKTPEPRPHQAEVFDDTIAFLREGQSGVVCAYTGWGKSPLGYAAAAAIGRKTLVITTKDDIFKQWIDGAGKFLGLANDEIGVIRGDKCEVEGCSFVVAMIQTLCKPGKITPDESDQFGLVIFDECHRVPAEQFSRVVDMFRAKLRLGLSATPKRSDGKELLVTAHIGPVRVATEAELMVPKVLRFTSRWKCPRVTRKDAHGDIELVCIPHEAGATTHIDKIIAADTERNHMVARLIKQAHEKGRRVVVFSTLHDHLKALHRACAKQEGISAKDMGFYIGATTKAEKEKREKDKVKPILFTTYGMMGEGTSIDWLDTAILAMPRANVTQPVGRIRREYPDKKPIVVMDVVDNDSPVFANYAKSRRKWYASIKCEVKDL